MKRTDGFAATPVFRAERTERAVRQMIWHVELKAEDGVIVLVVECLFDVRS